MDKRQMDKRQNRRLWIDALRSGLYKQSYGHLRKKSGYCCLGVACEIYQKEVGDLVVNVVYYDDDEIYSYNGNELDLPRKVKDWLGLSSFNGDFADGTLSVLNDDERVPFEEIADLIESQPSGLFMEEVI